MTHTVVVYEYATGSEQLHAENGDAHVAFLQRLMDDGVLKLSGAAGIDENPGALLVLACEPQEAPQILAEDPFWTSGVVGRRRFWPWTVVFGADKLSS